MSAVLLIAAAAGITEVVTRLLWPAGDRFVPSHSLAKDAVLVLGWGLLGWVGIRALRSNAVPPQWAVLVIPALIWAYVLWPR